MTTSLTAEKFENYFVSFGKKACEIIVLAMAWEEMEFDPDAFLTALEEWRDCFKRSVDQP